MHNQYLWGVITVISNITYKQKIYCLLFFVILLSILSGCFEFALVTKNDIKPSLIKRIDISDNGGNSSIISDMDNIALFVKAFNTAEEIDMTPSTDKLSEYRITFEGENEKYTENAVMYIDKNLDNKTIFIMSDNIIKKISGIYFGSILANPVFNSLYTYSTPPVTYIEYGSQKIKINPSRYEWNFKKADSNYYNADKYKLEKGTDICLLVTDTKLISIDTAIKPDISRFNFTTDKNVVFSTIDIENDSPRLEDGLYKCLLELQWSQNNKYGFYGNVFYEFNIRIDNPPEFEVSASEIYPGELLVINASNINDTETINITTDIDFKPNIFWNGSQNVILLPVSYYHEQDKIYTINISADNTEQIFYLKLLKKDFITQYMKIDPGIASSTRNTQSTEEIHKKLYPLKPVCDPVKYWDGKFLQPVDGGRVTPSDFGKRRFVNNSPTSYRHNGLDIGQDQGTPVKATNNGRVLIADYLIETGNTVVIEHGYGIKSWYYHMESLNTSRGNMVKKGDIIGLVGSTGFSTCPHLHFAISVNEVYINPISLIENGVPLQ